MDNFDLIGALRTYASDNDYVFLYGDNFYQNYEASKEEYSNDQVILGSSAFVGNPTIVNSKITEIVYLGDLMIGKKFDSDGTAASLDETYIQKYDRRLQDLALLLASTIGTFACTHSLDISGISMRLDINKFDTNIDFVATLVTFTQYP